MSGLPLSGCAGPSFPLSRAKAVVPLWRSHEVSKQDWAEYSLSEMFENKIFLNSGDLRFGTFVSLAPKSTIFNPKSKLCCQPNPRPVVGNSTIRSMQWKEVIGQEH